MHKRHRMLHVTAPAHGPDENLHRVGLGVQLRMRRTRGLRRENCYRSLTAPWSIHRVEAGRGWGTEGRAPPRRRYHRHTERNRHSVQPSPRSGLSWPGPTAPSHQRCLLHRTPLSVNCSASYRARQCRTRDTEHAFRRQAVGRSQHKLCGAMRGGRSSLGMACMPAYLLLRDDSRRCAAYCAMLHRDR